MWRTAGWQFWGHGFREPPAVAEEDPHEMEKGGEAFRQGLAGPILGGIGLGRPGSGCLRVHV